MSFLDKPAYIFFSFDDSFKSDPYVSYVENLGIFQKLTPSGEPNPETLMHDLKNIGKVVSVIDKLCQIWKIHICEDGNVTVGDIDDITVIRKKISRSEKRKLKSKSKTQVRMNRKCRLHVIKKWFKYGILR